MNIYLDIDGVLAANDNNTARKISCPPTAGIHGLMWGLDATRDRFLQKDNKLLPEDCLKSDRTSSGGRVVLFVRKLYRVVATAPRFCATFAESKVA